MKKQKAVSEAFRRIGDQICERMVQRSVSLLDLEKSTTIPRKTLAKIIRGKHIGLTLSDMTTIGLALECRWTAGDLVPKPKFDEQAASSITMHWEIPHTKKLVRICLDIENDKYFVFIQKCSISKDNCASAWSGRGGGFGFHDRASALKKVEELWNLELD